MAESDSGCLPSPLRGTPGWWQELGREAEATAAEPSGSELSGSELSAEPTAGRRGLRKRATPIRAELVARVRREIAAGTYDTDDKWHAALDRLLEQI